jgi:hypothetical protein
MLHFFEQLQYTADGHRCRLNFRGSYDRKNQAC